jgi:hypothetical protein
LPQGERCAKYGHELFDLLTPAEKATHGVDKIKRLKDLCDIYR